MQKLRALWRYCLLLIFRRPVQQPAHVPDESAFPSPPPPITSPEPIEAQPSGNRHARRKQDATRRKLERARMRHDEWVTPGGPEPIHHPRLATASEHEVKPEPIHREDDAALDNTMLIADEWMEGDGGGDVLFEESEFYGTFNFRDTILKQLERYWVYIERMKRHDPDAYGFYKQIGATLLPYTATHTNIKHEFKKFKAEELEEYKAEIELTPWFKKHWPTFGCICIGTNPHDEARERTDLNGNLWCPKFIYFVRYQKQPWYVQPKRGGKFYQMTIWWDRADHPKTHSRWGVPNCFPIWVSDDGKIIQALKTRERSDGSARGEADWRIPYAYKEWAKQYGLTAQTMLAHHFANATKQIELSHFAMCRVEVTRGDLTAVFGIEAQRIPYFFRDRDVTLDRHGRRERIFHIVRPHIRSDGSAAPLQFRGLKEFEWASYHVSITVPGLDHFFLPDFDVPIIDLPRKSRPSKTKYMTEAELGGWMKEKIKAGFGAYR